jgi:hypothetical protein
MSPLIPFLSLTLCSWENVYISVVESNWADNTADLLTAWDESIPSEPAKPIGEGGEGGGWAAEEESGVGWDGAAAGE